LMVAWGAFAMGRGQATGAEQMAKQAPFAAI